MKLIIDTEGVNIGRIQVFEWKICNGCMVMSEMLIKFLFSKFTVIHGGEHGDIGV